MHTPARQIQYDIPGLVMASELKDDPFAVYKVQIAEAVEASGLKEITVRRVWQLIKPHRGRETKIRQKEIQELLQLTQSPVSMSIMALRRMPLPVCTDNRGCWNSWDDIIETINHLESRAESMWTTAAALKRGLRMREDSRKIEEMLTNGLR